MHVAHDKQNTFVRASGIINYKLEEVYLILLILLIYSETEDYWIYEWMGNEN